MELLFFLAVAAVFLSVLFLWLFSQSAQPQVQVTATHLSDLLDTFDLALPSGDIGKRIFAAEDWDFVCQAGSKDVAKLFLHERRSIAIAWVKTTLRQVSEFLLLHRVAVRSSSRTSLWSEARIFYDYILFWVLCKSTCALIWILGPFRTKHTLELTLPIADRLISGAANFLVGLEPSRLLDVRRAWKQTLA